MNEIRQIISHSVQLNTIGKNEEKILEKQLPLIVLQLTDKKTIDELAQTVGFPNILALLQLSSNPAILDSLISIIQTLLDNTSPSEITSTYAPYLHQGIHAADPRLIVLCLTQCNKAITNGLLDKVTEVPGIWPDLIECIQHEDMKVSTAVGRIFSSIGRINPRVLCEVQCVETVERVYKNSKTTIRARVVEALVLTHSWDVMSCYSSVLCNLVKWLDGSDVLMQLTALDILAKMVPTEAGFKFVTEMDVLNKLKMIVSKATEDGAFADLLAANVIAFIGKLGSLDASRLIGLEADYEFLKYVVKSLDSQPELCEAAVTALGLIGSTQEGAMYLRNKSIWPKFAQTYKRVPSHIRNTFFRALGAVFATALPELEGLFDTFGRDKLIQDSTKAAMNAFSDIKLAGISCLRGLARHGFVVKEMLANNLWITEYLINRSTESTHEGHIGKYDLIKEICATATSITMNDNQRYEYSRLQEYLKQGMYFARSEANVAVKSD